MNLFYEPFFILHFPGLLKNHRPQRKVLSIFILLDNKDYWLFCLFTCNKAGQSIRIVWEPPTNSMRKKERRFFQYLLKSIIPNLIEIYHSVFQFLKYLFIPNSNHFLLIPLPGKTVHTQPVVFWLWVGGRLLTFYTLTLSDCRINY